MNEYMGEILLTLTQALQMVGIAPSIMVILFLCFAANRPTIIIIPVLYFISLIASFLYVLLPVFFSYMYYPRVLFILAYTQTFLPALSYLLILQFLTNRVPAFLHWLILLVPLAGSSYFVYGAVYNEVFCISIDTCFDAGKGLLLHNVILSGVVFILLLVLIGRLAPTMEGDAVTKRHKYALITALILLNVALLAMDVAKAAGKVAEYKYIFNISVLKLTFVYIVLTSIFRVFISEFDIKNMRFSYRKLPLTKRELEIVKKMESLLEKEKCYKELGFNRSQCAKMLGISEHQLSRIINMQYKKSFSEVANEWRINDAKTLLLQTDQPVTVISFDVGFSSVTSFNRVFKSLIKMSPTEFREKAQKPK